MKSSQKYPFDVVTIGGATRDIFVKSERFENVPSENAPDGFNACLPLGAKIPVDELVIETGGGATNAAVTFARFGLKTSCVTRVGDDTGGRELIAQLKKEHVDVRGIERDPIERTAYSIILVAGTGHRAILVARGASRQLEKNRIPWNALRSRWIYLTSVSGNLMLLRHVFSHAKRNLSHVAWNPGNAEIDLGLKKLLPHLLQTDLLFLNLEEAAALAETSPRELDKIFRTLGNLPRQALVITDGAHGAYVHARGITWHAPSLKGKIVNTTGAGDAFGSGFVASLIKDGILPEALQIATLNAFGVVTHMGAKAGILKKLPSKTQQQRIKIREI